jgi:hypothetical protein
MMAARYREIDDGISGQSFEVKVPEPYSQLLYYLGSG